jgi:hypothetical protein
VENLRRCFIVTASLDYGDTGGGGDDAKYGGDSRDNNPTPNAMLQLCAVFFTEILECILNRCSISIDSKSTNDCFCFVAEVADMAKGFSLVYIGNVYLDERRVDSSQCISQCDTGVCECAWIDNDGIHIASGFVDSINDGALPIRLEMTELDSLGSALLVCRRDYV